MTSYSILYNNKVQLIETFSYSVPSDSTTSNISSDPLQICICENNEANATEIDCDPPSKSIKAIRGKEYTMLVVTVGQNCPFICKDLP